MQSDQVLYLKNVGVDYKSAESPDLWTFLESHFTESSRIGPKFNRMPAAELAEMITRGEQSLLEAMVCRHRESGRLTRIAEVIEMPYVVGMDNRIDASNVRRGQILKLVEGAGTPDERIVHILPTEDAAIRTTHKLTVSGGLYLDGHTAGIYDICPGSHDGQDFAWLAPRAEIKSITRDMHQKLDDITTMSRPECEAVIKRVSELLC